MPKDARKVILKVTPKGRKSPEEKQYLKSREELFSSLDEKEQKELKKLLRKLLDEWLNAMRREQINMKTLMKSIREYKKGSDSDTDLCHRGSCHGST
jgi:hypothetical protein